MRFMQCPPSKHQNRQGFTLIELLTVMVIISVLVGLLFPVASAVMNSAKKTQAATDIKSIITASSSYQADYGKLPLTSDQTNSQAGSGSDVDYGDPNPGASSPGFQLYDILRAVADVKNGFNTNNEYNPKRVVYFEANNVKNPKVPTSGILTEDFNNKKYTIKVGSMVDPWGNEYIVFFDMNGDGDLHEIVKTYYSNLKGSYGPRGPICAASMGADGSFGTNNSGTPDNSDDIISWK